MSDRLPCITPSCRRTAPAEKYESGAEIICAKCFRSLPKDLADRHKRLWRDIRKWRRKAWRDFDDPTRQARIAAIIDRKKWQLTRNWMKIREAVSGDSRSEDLDRFLDEVGLL